MGHVTTAVAQTSQSAVSQGFQACEPHDCSSPADLEIGDTAGLETCATNGCAQLGLHIMSVFTPRPVSGTVTAVELSG
jgi:hypothetical protein